MMADNTYMNQYISDGNKSIISLNNLYDTMLVGDADNPSNIFRVPIDDFFLKYRNELDSIKRIYSLPESLYYKPKMLSLQMYGTTELWLAILRANNMKNITEFHLPIIYIYDPAMLNDYINLFFKRENKIM